MRAVFAAAFLATFMLSPLAATAQDAPAEEATQPSGFADLIGQAKGSIMSNPVSALELASAAEAVAMDETQIATAKWLKGEALVRMNRADEAQAEIDAALKIAAAFAPDGQLQADLFKAQAGIAKRQADYAKAMMSLFKAHDIFAELGAARSQAIVLQNIGSIYNDAHQFERAIEYYDRAGRIWSDDPALDLSRLNNVANAYYEMGRYAESADGYQSALKIAEKVDATLLRARILTNIAHAQAGGGDLETASATLDQAHILTRQPAASSWTPFVYGVKAEIAFRSGDMETALASLQTMFNDVDLNSTVMPFREFHQLAFEVYEAFGDTSAALAHHAAFKRLDDEARDVAASANTALMSAQFDFATQELEIAKLQTETLEQEVALKEAQARQRLTIFLGASMIALVLIAGLTTSYLSIRRSRNKVRQANDQLSDTNVALEKALKAKTEFLATTSHEIRTPLNGIIGMAEILLRGEKLAPDTLDRVEAIHGSSHMMKAIVDDILDVSKMESGIVTLAPAPFKLPATLKDVERVWRDSAELKNVALKMNVASGPDTPETIIMDPQRFRQIAFNLVSNAVKFTDEGQVDVSSRIEVDGDRHWLVLDVADTGIGIPEDELEKIFEPFHQVDGGTTRAKSGTGLGLTICRNFARAMGGDVTVTSTPGEGATFTFRAPVEVPVSTFNDGDVLAVAIEANVMKQHLFKALFAKRDEDLVCINSPEDMTDLLDDGKAPRLVMTSASCLGASPPDTMRALMSIRKRMKDARIIVFADTDWAQAPMLKISGASDIVEGALSPVELITVLNSSNDESLKKLNVS